MSKIKKRVFRFNAWFIFPNSEREEPFLNEKSQVGWHLVKTNYFYYTLQKGEPIDYQYRMDFVSKRLGRAEYIQLLQDAGWEIVDTRRDELGLWAYCRKPRSDEETLELYTDAESKLESVRRIKTAYWRMVGLAFIVFALFAGVGVWQSRDWYATIGGLIGGLIGGIIGGIIGYIAIWRKIKRIKNDTL